MSTSTSARRDRLHGPRASARGGVDLSWLVGAAVAALVSVAPRPADTRAPAVPADRA